MATAAPVYEERRVSIGRVFQRAFSAISLNPLVIVGLALLVGAVPSIIMTYLFVQLGFFAAATPGAVPTGATFNQLMGAGFLVWLLTLVISALVQGALTRATVSASEGQRVSLGQSLASAIRVVLPLIGLTLLWAIGLMIGFILLVVPGIILILVWAVAVPSLVIEREGVMAAFRRSAELTKGARWKIFGLFLIIVVAYWLLSAVAGLVGLGTYSATNAAAGLALSNIIGGVVVGTLVNMLWGTIQPSLYVELRQWKEGTSAENLADVFA